MRTTWALSAALAILAALTAAAPIHADVGTGEAVVGNASPAIVDRGVSVGSVDPEAYFTVRTRISDRNTLRDVERVTVEVYGGPSSPGDTNSRRDHYTFWFDASDNSWHSDPSTNSLGSSFIDPSGSSHPSDLSASEDNYNFRILLNGTALPSEGWNLYVEVTDSSSASDGSETVDAFDVNAYISYSVDSERMAWSGLQAATTHNPSTDNPVSAVDIETNVSFDVRTKLSGDWSDGSGNLIAAEHTSFEGADPGGLSGTVGTSYSDVYAAESYGEDLSRGVDYFLDVPDGTREGTYTTTFYIETVQH